MTALDDRNHSFIICSGPLSTGRLAVVSEKTVVTLANSAAEAALFLLGTQWFLNME
jgi:hypothetical protein